MLTLECMKDNGADRGLSDWHPEIEAGIIEALAKGPAYEWTTGWYASTHECAFARIICNRNGLVIEVSVTDDQECQSLGSQIIPHSTNLDDIRNAIGEAWEEAEKSDKETSC